MRIEIIASRISGPDLRKLAGENYGTMIKGVVDLGRRVLALGGELHADAVAALLADGSSQEDLWGFNIHTDTEKGERLEFTSFFNIRPAAGNLSLEIEDADLKNTIKEIVDALVE
jgi:hypothetical protein